jgi:hypothetical protein
VFIGLCHSRTKNLRCYPPITRDCTKSCPQYGVLSEKTYLRVKGFLIPF